MGEWRYVINSIHVQCMSALREERNEKKTNITNRFEGTLHIIDDSPVAPNVGNVVGDVESQLFACAVA